jgi:hypothetical protein
MRKRKAIVIQQRKVKGPSFQMFRRNTSTKFVGPDKIRNPNIEIRNKRKDLNPNYETGTGSFGIFDF